MRNPKRRMHIRVEASQVITSDPFYIQLLPLAGMRM